MSLRQLFGAEGFWGAARVEDAIDVLLVAVALSVILSWLRRRATRPLLLAAALGIAVYALARWLNLYLTLQLFRVGAVVLLAATLLAYQEDVRRGFERLAAGQVFRRRRPAGSCEPTVTTIAEAAFDLAERRFGALIVLRGVEHLDRHLVGGWAVDGKLSVPLLLSIFDPHTPAHDGAVIVDEHCRLDRLGAHLPLTTNLAALEGRGTRHAAALGLAESSDSLVVVVSEERGTVSVARGEQLEPVATEEDLAKALSGFYDEKWPAARPRRSYWPRDMEIKVAAAGIALALWFVLAAPSEPIQMTYEVPIELRNIPDGWTIDRPLPAQVRVTLVGPEPAFRELSRDDLRLTFDLSNVHPGGNILPVENGSVNAPEALRVTRYDTESVYIDARKKARKPPP